MTDPYIDQYETLAYGPFAAQQITTVVMGLDAAFDSALSECAGRIAAATLSMEAALKRSGQLERVTYKPGADGDDPRKRAQEVLERAVRYAESRPGGEALAKRVLGGERLSTMKARRATKLIAALSHAIGVFTGEQDKLPEAAAFRAELERAKADLAALDASVRGSRIARREMTPEVAAAREAWIQAYTASKRIVEGVLRYQDKLELFAEVFDDRAESPHVTGAPDHGSAEPAA